MDSLKVNIKKKIDKSYSILIGKHLISSINKFIENGRYDKVAIITDSNINRVYSRYIKQIKNLGIIKFNAGEKNKNTNTYHYLISKLFEMKLSRKSLILAIGGGITGDLAGQAAATYMRGIDYINVPTTLLAMVDSSIGGKVGFDIADGKNVIGSFYQPRKVFIDLIFLSNLPEKEFLNGIAEIIKYAIIKDKHLFQILLKNRNKILDKDEQLIKKIIFVCCKIKKEIVERDEQDKDIRQILNFGHTIGHSIEAISKYKIPHGKAVSIGICFESLISNRLNLLPAKDLREIISLIRLYNLPINLPKYNKNKLIDIMKKDKKSQKGKLVFALPKKIGAMYKSIDGYGMIVKENILLGIFNEKCCAQQ